MYVFEHTSESKYRIFINTGNSYDILPTLFIISYCINIVFMLTFCITNVFIFYFISCEMYLYT